MRVPIEIEAAQLIMTHPDEFEPDELTQAEQTMNDWKQLVCPHCVEGWVKTAAGYQGCLYCDGTGKIWVKVKK